MLARGPVATHFAGNVQKSVTCVGERVTGELWEKKETVINTSMEESKSLKEQL